MGRRIGVCLVAIVLLAVACDSTPPPGRPEPTRTLPLETWVSGLCHALERFGDEVELEQTADAIPVPLPHVSPGELAAAMRRLAARIDALGAPDLPDGGSIGTDVLDGVRRAAATAEDIRAAGGIPPSAQVIPGGVRSAAWALAYPTGLFLLLKSRATAPAIAIYLTDPVRASTVSRVVQLLRGRADVTRITYVSKADACEEFKDTYANQPALVEAADCDALPASIRVTLAIDASTDGVEETVGGLPGIDEVLVQQSFNEFLADLTGIGDEELQALEPVRIAALDRPECTPYDA